MSIKTEYRGFEITFSEHDDSWKCELKADSYYSKEKLSVVKKRIDKFIKDESEFKDLKVIIYSIGYNSMGFTGVTITSVADNGEAWIRNKNGNREKLYKGADIYKITTRNDHFISLYNENLSKISSLQDENELIKSTKMEKIDITKNIKESE